MIEPYHGVLSILKNTDMCYNMNESSKYKAKWKKAKKKKSHVLFDSICRKFPEELNLGSASIWEDRWMGSYGISLWRGGNSGVK